jgi:hypothetical protein
MAEDMKKNAKKTNKTTELIFCMCAKRGGKKGSATGLAPDHPSAKPAGTNWPADC